MLRVENKTTKKLKTIPIRAAKTLGPEFTGFFFSPSKLIINFEKMLKMLYFEFSVPLKVKSIKRNMAINRLLLMIKAANNKTVNVALSRAMCSSILLVDMGQMAFEFIK
jgi:hypothetical protein